MRKSRLIRNSVLSKSLNESLELDLLICVNVLTQPEFKGFRRELQIYFPNFGVYIFTVIGES